MSSETRLRSKHFQDVSQCSESDQDRKSVDRKYNVPPSLLKDAASAQISVSALFL